MTRNSILVGVDGSHGSDAALAWAVDEAAARRARLLVVNAIDTTGMGPWGLTASLRAGLRDLNRPIVDRALERARARRPDLDISGRVLIGSPTRVFMVMSDHVELIVVGRDGRGALQRAWFGGLPDRLLANARCPIVAAGADHTVGGSPHIGRVVIGCAGDDTDEPILGWGFDLASRRRIPVLAVHAVHQPAGLVLPSSHAPSYLEAVVEAEHYLEKRLIEWTHRYPHVLATRVARTGGAATVLPDVCRPDDLLVLGHHHRAPFVYRPLGPHATAAVRASTCAVAVVHPGDDDELADR